MKLKYTVEQEVKEFDPGLNKIIMKLKFISLVTSTLRVTLFK